MVLVNRTWLIDLELYMIIMLLAHTGYTHKRPAKPPFAKMIMSTLNHSASNVQSMVPLAKEIAIIAYVVQISKILNLCRG